MIPQKQPTLESYASSSVSSASREKGSRILRRLGCLAFGLLESEGNPKHHDQEENSDRGDEDPHRDTEPILFLSDRDGIVKAARRILLLLGLDVGYSV